MVMDLYFKIVSLSNDTFLSNDTLFLCPECARWTWFWLYWTSDMLYFGHGTTVDQNQILAYQFPEGIVPVFGAIGAASGEGNSGNALWDFDVSQSKYRSAFSV